MKVAIIGGGVMGCATALALAGRGVDVVVLERAVPGAEASSAAAGILGAQIELHGRGEDARALPSRARRVGTLGGARCASRRGSTWGTACRACCASRSAPSRSGPIEHDVAWQREQGPARRARRRGAGAADRAGPGRRRDRRGPLPGRCAGRSPGPSSRAHGRPLAQPPRADPRGRHGRAAPHRARPLRRREARRRRGARGRDRARGGKLVVARAGGACERAGRTSGAGADGAARRAAAHRAGDRLRHGRLRRAPGRRARALRLDDGARGLPQGGHRGGRARHPRRARSRACRRWARRRSWGRGATSARTRTATARSSARRRCPGCSWPRGTTATGSCSRRSRPTRWPTRLTARG